MLFACQSPGLNYLHCLLRPFDLTESQENNYTTPRRKVRITVTVRMTVSNCFLFAKQYIRLFNL